jgi:Reverse transcriptase (RNA-dependent DNA polymerase)
MTASEKFTGSNPKWFKNLRTFGEIGITYNNQKIKGKLDNKGYPCMFIGYTEDHASNVYVFYNLNNQAIFMSRNVVWLHKLFHQHMKTKSALIPGFNVYDISPSITDAHPIPPAIAPTIAPAPITPRLTRTTAPCILNPPSISASDDSDDDDHAPIPPHAPFDMHDTNAPLTPHLPRELRNLETFYNPKPGDKSNIALLTHHNTCEDELLAYPYTVPGTDIEIVNDDVEFCNTHLPEYDSNPQSSAQALLSKKSKHWWQAMITEFLNCEEKKVWVIVPKSKVPKGRKIIVNRWVYAEKDNGTFRSRTVAKGFSQIPGRDFQEHHSPDVHDTTFHVVLV